MAGSHPDRALGGNSPVLKSVLSLAEVEQLIEHAHPGGKFRRRKASFTLRNSYYCDKVAELIGWAAIAVFFPFPPADRSEPRTLQVDAAVAVHQRRRFIPHACVCKAGYEYRPLAGRGCRSYCRVFPTLEKELVTLHPKMRPNTISAKMNNIHTVLFRQS